jgi:hypothetical protein
MREKRETFMTEVSEFTNIEEKMAREYDRDGMVEFVLGLGLTMGGLSLATRSGTTVSGLVPIYVILIARLWKKKITYPRLGYAEFLSKRKKERKTRMLMFLLVLFLAVALAMLILLAAAGSLGDLSFLSGREGKLIFGGLVALMFVALGAIRKMKHLYAFAVLCYLLCIGTYLLHVSGGWALSITGALLLAVGLARLVTFLRANPKLEGKPAE